MVAVVPEKKPWAALSSSGAVQAVRLPGWPPAGPTSARWASAPLAKAAKAAASDGCSLAADTASPAPPRIPPTGPAPADGEVEEPARELRRGRRARR